ncbi:extensin-like [Contarinia nasturtii]|uniref:extensin-like n=1 Tax=Contarinia nasturtii TaxID=265458 RepID=UPI0012D398AD|nr:extensin-like [Contarinia nasturtii]
MNAFILCFVTLFVTASAQQKCPENSNGIYPSCKCLNGAVFDVNYNWCASNLKELGGQCPQDGPGIYPNCNCGVGKKFDVEKQLCTAIDRNVCPKGSYGDAPHCQCPPTFAFDEIHWFCRPWYLSTTAAPKVYTPPPPSCGAYQYGTYPDCHYRPCPKHSLNPEEFEPHCKYNYTHHVYTPCPQGQVGSPPNCYTPCPAHHRGRYPNCERIRCQTGEGWTGEFEPDCRYTPSCPPEFPGVWPNCDIYKAKVSTQKPFTTPQVHDDYKPGQTVPNKPVTPPAPNKPTPPTATNKPRSPATYLPPTTTTTSTTTRKPSTTAPTYLPPGRF